MTLQKYENSLLRNVLETMIHFFMILWWIKNPKEQHLFKNEIFCNIRHVLMSPLITLMHPYWKKFWLTNKFLCCVHFVLCASVHSVGYYLLQYKHCQSDQQGISSFTSRRRSNFLLLCLLRALSRSLSYLSWYRLCSNYFTANTASRAVGIEPGEMYPHFWSIDFSTSLRYIVCVLASHWVCARVCVCARVSYNYARGEFVRARLIGSILLLPIDCPAQFISNPYQTHLKQPIKVFRIPWKLKAGVFD